MPRTRSRLSQESKEDDVTLLVESESVKGTRKYQEDRIIEAKHPVHGTFVAIADGHGGSEVADWLAASFPKHIWAALDMCKEEHPKPNKYVKALQKACYTADFALFTDHFKASEHTGSTLAGALINSYHIFTVHVGDSRLLLLGDNGKILLATQDHRAIGPEAVRIRKAGGIAVGTRAGIFTDKEKTKVASWGTSRAFGDFSGKIDQSGLYSWNGGVMSGAPSIHHRRRELVHKVIIGSDGLFDGLRNHDVTKSSKPGKLVERAQKSKGWDGDNTTALVLMQKTLNQSPDLQEEQEWPKRVLRGNAPAKATGKSFRMLLNS